MLLDYQSFDMLINNNNVYCIMLFKFEYPNKFNGLYIQSDKRQKNTMSMCK